MSRSAPGKGGPSWYFDEFQDFGWSDPSTLTEYDRKANVDPEVEGERLRQLGVSSEHSLIDFGCGTGALTLEAAKVCRRVVAVDVSEAMLDLVRQKADALGLENIEYVRQGFLTYEHQGEALDFAFSQRSLHQLPDRWKVQALKRMADVLEPGGILFVRDILFSFEPAGADEAIGAWLDSRPGDSFPREFFEHDLREEYITYTWLFEVMLERAGFEIRKADYGEWQAYAKYVCVKK